MMSSKLLGVALVATTAAVGCDSGAFVTGSGLEKVPVQVTTDVANLAVSGVSVEVTGPGMDTPILANLPITAGVATGSLEVLAGSDRAFVLRAFDVAGVETHHGADTVDVAGSQTTTLSVSLTPLVGDVDLGGQIGEYALVVTPRADTVAAGGTVQLSVAVTDAYGATVQNPTVTWGSLNPAVASVDATGLVSGLVPGQTTIAASYKGFSGSASVTVQ